MIKGRTGAQSLSERLEFVVAKKAHEAGLSLSFNQQPHSSQHEAQGKYPREISRLDGRSYPAPWTGSHPILHAQGRTSETCVLPEDKSQTADLDVGEVKAPVNHLSVGHNQCPCTTEASTKDRCLRCSLAKPGLPCACYRAVATTMPLQQPHHDRHFNSLVTGASHIADSTINDVLQLTVRMKHSEATTRSTAPT